MLSCVKHWFKTSILGINKQSQDKNTMKDFLQAPKSKE